jgi:hypothetical protein
MRSDTDLERNVRYELEWDPDLDATRLAAETAL